MTKYTNDFKKEVVSYYFSSYRGYRHTASYFNICRSNVRTWVQNYQRNGVEAIVTQNYSIRYSHTFKMQVIEAILKEKLSLREVRDRFNLRHTGTISQWLSTYQNKGIDALRAKPRGCQSQMKQSVKKPDNQKTQKELLEELEYLRAEVAYLKKLDALIQKKKNQNKKLKSSQN